MRPEESAKDVTGLLRSWEAGDPSALDELMELVYQDLRRIAANCFAREGAGHTLDPTGLVHEAYLRLVDQRRAHWRNRLQFFSVAARMMRRLLVDHARRKRADKRVPVTLPMADRDLAPEGFVEWLALDQALERLREVAPRQAEIVELRFFAGLTVEEVAAALGKSPRTVKLDWRMARAFLVRDLRSAGHPGGATVDSGDD